MSLTGQKLALLRVLQGGFGSVVVERYLNRARA